MESNKLQRSERELRKKLNKSFRETMNSPLYKKEIDYFIKSLGSSKKRILDLLFDYNVYLLKDETFENGRYFSKEMSLLIYLHNLLAGSYHQVRQNAVIEFLKEASPKSILEIGFEAPSKYVFEYVSNNNCKLTLSDVDQNSLDFAKFILDYKNVSGVDFNIFDLNDFKTIGAFDVYLFMDSIEHAKNPSESLKKIVKQSSKNSKFILSLPICKIDSFRGFHFIEWKTEEDAERWLNDCGLKIDRKIIAKPNPEVDYFSDFVKGGFYNIIVRCSKIDLINKRTEFLRERYLNQPYKISLDGFNLVIDKGIFPPETGATSYMIAEVIKRYSVKKAIDMGCGSGYFAMILKKQGIKEVWAVDDNPRAVKCAKANADLNDIDNICILESDLFCQVPKSEKFDLVVFNHPYYPLEDHFFGRTGEGGASIIRRFLMQVQDYLQKNSRIIMPFSDFAGKENDPKIIAEEMDFDVSIVKEIENIYGVHYLYEIKQRKSQYDNFYDKYSQGYETFFESFDEYPLLVKDRISNLYGKKLLDIGCGIGDNINYFFNLGAEVFGIDDSKEMINQGKKKYAKLRNCFIKSNFESLPFDDESFDVINSSFAIHYAEDPINAFKEIFRVLKKEGIAHIFVAHPMMPFLYKNNKDYHKPELVKLPLFEGKVWVNEHSHTFSDYLNKFVLQNFNLEEFYEGKNTLVEKNIGNEIVKVPTFIYLRLVKK
ncbi:MAG: methyltransferase domain-containing protein [Nanoarchaeota archaeon]